MNESTRAAHPSGLAEPTTEARDPDAGRGRRALPWVVAAVAVLLGAVAIGLLVVDEASEPRPVAQLTPQGRPDPGSIPADDESAVAWGVTVADFVSYGSYGDLQVWGTTEPEAKRCIAVVVERHISVMSCAAPSLDTIADFDIDPDSVPRAPSGEPAANIRFVLHEDVVDVYLAPNPEGGFY
ncbi:hypothetical protein [Cellulomonas cellasea]|uniref:Uncharacterized protein n=1 Tax=Cellulomonas cellasea TaxID=43670 RepID=A0A7W4UH55_9CELL|nr:hypothetical protein [Cellulomonas cellasea]MBB2924089.1 hypothetical protein [Cellulomonas cellasea]